MSGVLRTVGKIAGIVALIPSPIQPYAAAVAAVATIGAQLTARPPLAQGSTTEITIGANQPSPQILGRCYFGGSRVHMVGYGEEDDVQNAHLAIADVFSVGGPVQGLVQSLFDFSEITFSGTNAEGFYHNYLHRTYQLGDTPESAALAEHWAGAPDWGSDYKLSGKAAWLLSARWPRDGKKFGSGFPQSGAVWDGVLRYDPREDSTYPGGSGAQRWSDPAETADFTTAKATWAYTQNPGVHALGYSLGSWEGGEPGGDAIHRRVFGMGLPIDAIWVEDFVEFANVCDANGWNCDGVIFEPGDGAKWENLKNICAAGGAEPVWRGGKLGLMINAPGVALDTIQPGDLAEGEYSAPAMQGMRERLDGIIPEYKSAAHKWEFVASDAIRVSEDGAFTGERIETRRFNMVAGGTGAADQAAQLAAYELLNGLEAGPFDLPIGPRLRGYGPGNRLEVSAALVDDLGLPVSTVRVLGKRWNAATMRGVLRLVTDDPAKHAQALAQTGTLPPGITITPPEDLDGVVNGLTPAAPTIDSITLDWSSNSGSETAGVRLSVTVEGPDDVELEWHLRWWVDGEPGVPTEQVYSNVPAGASALLLSGFVPTNTDVKVEAAFRVPGGLLSEWAGPVDVSTRVTADTTTLTADTLSVRASSR